MSDFDLATHDDSIPAWSPVEWILAAVVAVAVATVAVAVAIQEVRA